MPLTLSLASAVNEAQWSMLSNVINRLWRSHCVDTEVEQEAVVILPNVSEIQKSHVTAPEMREILHPRSARILQASKQTTAMDWKMYWSSDVTVFYDLVGRVQLRNSSGRGSWTLQITAGWASGGRRPSHPNKGVNYPTNGFIIITVLLFFGTTSTKPIGMKIETN